MFGFAFVLALIAGVALGVLGMRYSFWQTPSTPQPQSGSVVPTLDDLQLSDDQRMKIQKIWEGVKDLSDQSYRQANQLQQKFDDNVKSILTQEQMDRYKAFHDQYQTQFLNLQGERDAAVKKAIEQTKSLLSDDQKQKYDVILQNRLGRPAGTAPSSEALPQIPKAVANPSGGSVS